MSLLPVTFSELNLTIFADKGDSLYELMRKHKLLPTVLCDGVGCCGACRVVVNGKERFACKTSVVESLEVLVAPALRADRHTILANFVPDKPGDTGAEKSATSPGVLCASTGAGAAAGADAASAGSAGAASAGSAVPSEHYALAIDLGTTTLVGKLINLASGLELASFAELNPQQAFGLDVLSRINLALDDASTLNLLIRQCIDKLVRKLLKSSSVEPEQVIRVVVVGNTAMSYLLLGLPCRSLGFAPFVPEFTIESDYSWKSVFHTDTLACELLVLPYISAFVGGDLVAALCALQREDDFLLIDLGTNGEILYKRGGKLLCTAVAAGPALEGASIECGSASVLGAISSVDYQEGKFVVSTIGNAKPTSICGSGVLDVMAALVREGFVDSTGLMTETCGSRIVLAGADSIRSASADSDSGTFPLPPLDSFIYFSQNDVRQVQLAKSALRASIEVILEAQDGVLPQKVFLAGGFGQREFELGP